jgi:predicted DNA-binding protein
MPDRVSKPFPIQMEVEFLDRLSEPVRDGKAKSVSEIIRTALERYDLDDIVVLHPAQVLMSVRLGAEVRRNLRKVSRAKHTSVGHLVRAAVEAYLPELEALPSPEAPAAKPRRKRKRARAKPRTKAKAKPRKR